MDTIAAIVRWNVVSNFVYKMVPMLKVKGGNAY